MYHEDLIDFACSDTWLAYYHARGMTCREPAPEPTQRRADVAALMARIERLEQQNAELRASKVRYVPLPVQKREEETPPPQANDFGNEL